MAAGCVRRLLGLAASTACPRSRVLRAAPLCTAPEDAPEAPGNRWKKPDPRARPTLSSVGHEIPHRPVQLLGESGEDLGVMNRANVLKLLDLQGLKLMLRDKSKEPAVYQLMSGRRLHEMRTQQKERAVPVQVKELAFSSSITPHDLATKLRQVESWLQRSHQVRLTLRCGHRARKDALDSSLAEMLQQLGVAFRFVSQPRVVREGKTAVCVLRPPTAKEQAKEAQEQAPPAGLEAAVGGAPA
ncbi:translation initiation factor IF-3, mitochondrial [Neosynchiropus ocellatus]